VYLVVAEHPDARAVRRCDVDRHNRGCGLAMTKDRDPLAMVLGLVDELGQVGLGVRERGLTHETIMTNLALRL
jgi:hypothetical protein